MANNKLTLTPEEESRLKQIIADFQAEESERKQKADIVTGYKITTRRTITDPEERRIRLQRLYDIFERRTGKDSGATNG